ncbi:hypothetical protein PTTG_00974 [Puccinia triticina 1-1 BBBD Race 1]|uniref:PB1 domain-containing protein n=2 Tax=Puccinia triticina TaxID=208348 RepID=A0A180GW67_PUCT1|nr:uncharacterized protein PtA15_3A728 [Puccinia triticina]OAV96522.1 hypothetical protein PTTG_00974 [Puccinia triticina 1-1 BBBD Race 1]WAQ83358.1 hypothetical protein PtA15_3A728 [Puccinia triticina]WAR54205.1 hypothetical protein PtB15_3B718 [Puccinia triticina]
MASHQAPLFIKIKHADSTRKVQVPNQPAPVWSKLSAAIVERFGIPKEQPIGLEYVDPEGDIITISSQVEFDELWDEITLAAQSTRKGGVEQRTLTLLLVLIGRQSPQPTQPSDRAQGHPIVAGSATAAAPTANVDDSGVDASTSDPPEYPINTSPSPISQPPLADPSLGLSALITAIDTIAPKLQDTLGGYAQMIVQVADQLSDTCQVIASRLQQEPSVQTGPIPRAKHSEDILARARSTDMFAPPPNPPHPPFGFAPHPARNENGPSGLSAATALPCNSPLDHLWFTRAAARNNYPVPDSHNHASFRPNEFVPPFAPVTPRLPRKSPFEEASFGCLQGKDRHNPPTFFPEDPTHEIYEGYRPYRPNWLLSESARNSPNLPDKAHNGLGGFGDVRGQGRSSPASHFANECPAQKSNIRFGGAGIEKSRDEECSSFRPMFNPASHFAHACPAPNSNIGFGFGGAGIEKSQAKECPSFKPMFRNLNVSSLADKHNHPSKNPFGDANFGSNPSVFFPCDFEKIHPNSSYGGIIPAGVFGPHPILAKNATNVPGKTHLGKSKSKLESADIEKSPEAELKDRSTSILANQDILGGLGRDNAARRSPAPSLTLPNSCDHPKKKHSVASSDDDDNCSWPERAEVNLARPKWMVEPATGTSARRSGNGGAEKKKGLVSWADSNQLRKTQAHGLNFSKPRNTFTRKLPTSFAESEENSDNESQNNDAWGQGWGPSR